MINPYESPSHGTMSQRSHGEHARLIRSAFLYRVIEFDRPFVGRLTYSSWWWRQRVDINGQNVWFRISWLRIHRRIQFEIPKSPDRDSCMGEIEIEFSRGLKMRRFRLLIDADVVYEEKN